MKPIMINFQNERLLDKNECQPQKRISIISNISERILKKIFLLIFLIYSKYFYIQKIFIIFIIIIFTLDFHGFIKISSHNFILKTSFSSSKRVFNNSDLSTYAVCIYYLILLNIYLENVYLLIFLPIAILKSYLLFLK